MEEFFTVTGDPNEVYTLLAESVQKHVSPIQLSDVAWVTDELALRDEALDGYNRNCELTAEQVASIDLKDWQPLLSKDERGNYDGYLKKLFMNHIEPSMRPTRMCCVGQDPTDWFMAGNSESLPTFTKDSTRRMMVTNLNRWLTAEEKMAVTGFPVHEDLLGCC